MKTLKLMCAALVAAVALAGCQKEDSGKDNGSKQPKSITISLSNVKVPAKSLQNQVQNGTAAKVNTYQVFFANAAGTAFYEGLAADGSEVEHFITVNDPATDLTKTFHFVDPAVEQVLIIANFDTEQTFATVTDLKAAAVTVASQQNVDKLILFGEDTALTSLSGDHSSEHQASNVYEAEVEIAPLVARLEVVNFSTAFGTNPAFESVTVNKIAFNDYYTTAHLSGAVEARENTEIDAANVYTYLGSLNGTSWAYDNLTAVMTPLAETATFADNKVYAYNFFPVAGTTGTEEGYPQLIIGASALDKQGNTVQQYLDTESFNGVAAPGFEPGKVYRVQFAFSVDNLENQLKCVEVTVTVKEWTVVSVTPNV